MKYFQKPNYHWVKVVLFFSVMIPLAFPFLVAQLLTFGAFRGYVCFEDFANWLMNKVGWP